MENLKFIPIELTTPVVSDEPFKSICESMRKLYSSQGFYKPWIGYFVSHSNGEYVGTCAYKTPPQNGRVEIAYFTLPGFEGAGVATLMARHLVNLSIKTDPKIQIFAQTLAVENASNHILKKIGFQFKRDLIHPEDGLIWEWELPLS